MEPMALGSPSSPQSSSAYLPAYLIGEPMTPPRNTTISPTKGGRALAFGQSPSSPKDPLNRSSAFHNRNPLSPSSGNIFMANHQGPGQNLNASVSGGPPTQGLFDTLSTERNFIQDTSSPRINSTTTATGLPLHQQQFRQISSPFTPQQQPTSTMNDSLFNVTTPRRQSIIPGPKHNFTSSPFPAAPQTNANNQTTTTIQNPADCWVTVFGFPQSATSMILSHFSQCGTIINKLHPQNTGNWMHLKYTSRLECDRALNYNEKILNNFFMIGVTRCKDPAVLELDQREDVENNSFAGNSMSSTVTNRGNLNNTSISGNNSSIRPLAYVAYKTVQSPADVVSPTAPTKSSGILDRAMDFFLSW